MAGLLRKSIYGKARKAVPWILGLLVLAVVDQAYGQIVGNPTSGRAVFLLSCTACHGSDGKGTGPVGPALTNKPANLTDCRINQEESSEIVAGTIREGGHYQGLSYAMPSFKGVLNDQQIADVASYIKTLCTDPYWVPGDLNLPRPLITDKAYPEQEAIIGSRFGQGENRATEIFADIEFRLNGLTNIEFGLPYLDIHPDGGQPASGLGDADIAINRVVAFSRTNLWLASVGLKLGLPTGSQSRGLGTGELVWEPFFRAGWDWHRMVIQGNVILEFPQKTADINSLIVYSLAIGRYFQPDPRLQITPMVEFNNETSLVGSTRSDTKSTVLPELRVKWLQWSTGFGAQLPITEMRDFDFLLMFDITYEYMLF